MRDREQIEQDMLHARTDLEDTVGALAHRVREKTAVKARLRQLAFKHAGTIAMVAGGFILLFAIGKVRRALAS
jgi:hypothetical protein